MGRRVTLDEVHVAQYSLKVFGSSDRSSVLNLPRTEDFGSETAMILTAAAKAGHYETFDPPTELVQWLDRHETNPFHDSPLYLRHEGAFYRVDATGPMHVFTVTPEPEANSADVISMDAPEIHERAGQHSQLLSRLRPVVEGMRDKYRTRWRPAVEVSFLDGLLVEGLSGVRRIEHHVENEGDPFVLTVTRVDEEEARGYRTVQESELTEDHKTVLRAAKPVWEYDRYQLDSPPEGFVEVLGGAEYVYLDGQLHSVDVQESRPDWFDFAVEVLDPEITEDDPATLRFSVTNVAGRTLEVFGGIVFPFFILRAYRDGDDAAEYVHLWNDEYDGRCHVDEDGNLGAFPDLGTEAEVEPGETLSQTYSLRHRDFEPGAYTTTGYFTAERSPKATLDTSHPFPFRVRFTVEDTSYATETD
ncbi:hypothetical protein [Haloarchaeobius sp. DFWS5]|uniref:hypothetical protein n=1 Tax=Haloarchaeobius sp. DFWS5 TaxID=3446114 RepID=UPI003EB798A6